MKKFIIMLLLCLPAIAFTQTEKKDTVYQQVPVYEHTDTVKVKGALILGENNFVKYVAPAFALLKGFAVQVPDPADKKKTRWQWTQDPKVDGILDANKKKVANYLSLIN